MSDPIRVLLVDDHELVRQGLRAFLSAQEGIEIVGESTNADAAVARCAVFPIPNVVLMDLALGDESDGITATQCIRERFPDIRVLVVSSFEDEAHIIPAMRAGANGYLFKDVRPAELAEAIRRTARGENVLHPRVASIVVRSLQEGREKAASAKNHPFTDLTEREREVLEYLAQGFANARIAESLFLSEKTVKWYVSSLLSKLGLEDRTQAAVYAWREGLVTKKDTRD
ncbi:MAG: response regulator transcription factor [Fibrella sp.]|nr:response regulator transcription factor [Armatimonadota bacterium]